MADQAITTGSIGNQIEHYKPVVRVLIACERSGKVRQAFRDRGHDAWSCDLVPADDGSAYHLQVNALAALTLRWDLVIAHPPCRYLSRARPQNWRDHPDEVAAALAFVAALWSAPVGRLCIENSEGKARIALGAPSQVIQPYQFGHPYTKRTLLWYRGLPPLFSTCVVQPSGPWVGNDAKGGHRSQVKRSETFAGIAAAMADQWGAA